MLPLVNKRETGVNLRRIMDERGLTVKDIQHYLKLGSVQSVYHWLNGISLPTVDNLYALSYLFKVPVDDMTLPPSLGHVKRKVFSLFSSFA